MNLNNQIRRVIHSLRETLPPDLSSLIEEGAGEISALDISGQALNIGDRAPVFSLKDYQGNSHSIASYLAKGPLVVTFYRGVWCPYCNLQLAEYSRRFSEIRRMGANLIAISPQLPNALEIFAASNAPIEAKESIVSDTEFVVLHDRENNIAKEFGLVFDIPKSHLDLFKLLEIDLEKINGQGGFAVPDPATYIISQDARIHWRFVPNNYRKRAEVDQILQALIDA